MISINESIRKLIDILLIRPPFPLSQNWERGLSRSLASGEGEKAILTVTGRSFKYLSELAFRDVAGFQRNFLLWRERRVEQSS
jgi:hypothetical protein